MVKIRKRGAFVTIHNFPKIEYTTSGFMSFLSMEMFTRMFMNHFVSFVSKEMFKRMFVNQLEDIPSSKCLFALNEH